MNKNIEVVSNVTGDARESLLEDWCSSSDTLVVSHVHHWLKYGKEIVVSTYKRSSTTYHRKWWHKLLGLRGYPTVSNYSDVERIYGVQCNRLIFSNLELSLLDSPDILELSISRLRRFNDEPLQIYNIDTGVLITSPSCNLKHIKRTLLGGVREGL